MIHSLVSSFAGSPVPRSTSEASLPDAVARWLEVESLGAERDGGQHDYSVVGE
ncbi:hypothetical protein [Micromonospora avicenniae]|uniref:hypothetical protein n=1 Tax=Micromonospora avicenniae TaxID=1198245 RepID=UPI00344443DF